VSKPSPPAAWRWQGINPVLGTERADTLYGTPEDDVLLGLGGDDLIVDGPGPGTGAVRGRNLVLAGPGDDGVYAGYGDDTVDGGPGDDAINGQGRTSLTPGGTIRLWARDGADLLRGGPPATTPSSGRAAPTPSTAGRATI
jgi:Ca2+-binding RTX toxin-like protein